MFGFVKRFKQMAGIEPLEKKHLGQYAFKEDFENDFTFEIGLEFGKPNRINTDIYLNAYETNSFKVSIVDRFKVQEFNLVRMPIEENGYDVYPVMNDNRVKFIIAIKKKSAYIKMIDATIGTRYFN